MGFLRDGGSIKEQGDTIKSEPAGRGRNGYKFLDYLGGRKFIGLLIAVGVYWFKGLTWEMVVIIGLYFGVNLMGKGIFKNGAE